MNSFAAPPFAFFAQPALLGWLACAAVPILIHLWNRRRYREVEWAAMRYLLAAMRNSSRRVRIEQWLLLALRTLAIASIMLAAAEPFLDQIGLTGLGGENVHRLLVLDGSYSMGARPADRSRFERAKELAIQIVNESRQGDLLTVLSMADPPREIVGAPSLDSGEVLEEIESLELPDAGADLPATMVKIEEMLARALDQAPRIDRTEVYFLSDLGRNHWLPEFSNEQAAGDFRERSQRLGETADLVLVDLGGPGGENLAIGRIEAVEPFATANREATFTATIRNFGEQSRPRTVVEWLVDGRRAATEHVDVGPGDEATTTLSHRFDEPGEHHVEARISGDQLEVDNRRRLAMTVKGQLRALCVDGKPAHGDDRGATFYLATALSPRGETDAASPIRPEVVPERALTELDLDDYDCIFLANVEKFGANEAQALDAYLNAGGGVAIFLGDLVQADRYNRFLGSTESGGRAILPAPLGERVVQDQYRPLDVLDCRHPLLAPFRNRPKAGLYAAGVRGWFTLPEPAPDSGVQVALRLENGSPLIVERPVGRGRLVLAATSADASWSTLPVWGSYVPLVQRMLAFTVRGQSEQRNLLVGQSLGGSLGSIARDAHVTVALPGEKTETARLVRDRDQASWEYSETFKSGLYVAEIGRPAARRELFAVNVSVLEPDPARSESDLTPVERDELATQTWPDVRYEHRTDWRNAHDDSPREVVRRSNLQAWLLAGALALLMAETTLACWLARRAA